MSCFIFCYAECHYAECRYAECNYAESRYAECHYAECRYAESCGPLSNTPEALFFVMWDPSMNEL